MSQNVWKTAFTLFVIFQITQAWELVCYKGSRSNFKRVTYTNAAELITSGYYDVTQDGVMYAHGYKGSPDTQGTDVLMEALLQKNGTNVCAVDWKKEASFGPIDVVDYPAVIVASKLVQKELAKAIQIMTENGMEPQTVHLMGLSMGAHVVGNAGRIYSKLTNEKIARVTGFDPAKPGFDGSFSLNERIDKTSGNFVDIIHTDTNQFGMATPTGHVDFYANLIEYKQTGVQPGCNPSASPLTPEGRCSHLRSVYLYIDALKYTCQLQAAQAADETVWGSPGFVPEVVACIGEDIIQTLRGNFYLRTNGQSPFGLGEAGAKAA